MTTAYLRLLHMISAGFLLSCALGAAQAQGTPQPENAKSADSFVDTIGIDVRLRYTDTAYGNYPLVKQMLLQAGIRHIRDGISPFLPDGPLQISEENDLAASGIKSDIIFDTYSYQANTDPVQGIVSSINLVASAIEYAEGPNETDGSGFTFNGNGFPQGAIDFQNALWAAVKKSQLPSLPVIAPSMSNPLYSPQMAGMQYVSNYGNTHSYHGARNPETTLQNLGMLNFYIPDAQQESSTLPIIASETGNWVGTQPDTATGLWQPPITALSQGKYALRTYAEYFNDGIVRTYEHELIDEKPVSNAAEQNFGILYNNGTPKPAYTGIQNLIATLADPGPAFTPGALTYSLSGATANIHHLLLQKRDGSFYLVLWQAVQSYDFTNFVDIPVAPVPITVGFSGAVGQIAQIDPATSSTPFTASSNVSSLTVNVPDKLLILHIPCLPDLIVTHTGYTGNATAGAPVTFTATIKNIGHAATPSGVTAAVGFYVNGSASPSSWGEIAGNAPLAPGASYNITADFPTTLRPGQDTVSTWVDDVGRIAEVSENNNKLLKKITIR